MMKKLNSKIKRTKHYDVIGGWIKFQLRAMLHFFTNPMLYFKNLYWESRFKPKHFLSVVAIMKNEGPYLKEWIEFHRLVGVEKFYLYDNESTDNTKEILAPYIKKGIVEYTYFPGQKQQRPAYNDCIRRHKYDTKWLAIFDLDEFLVPVSFKNIPEFLKTQPSGISQIVVAWVLFGSSGHKKKPEGLVVENYKRRANKNNHHYKAIVNPRRVYSANVHGQVVFGKIVDTNGESFHNMRHKADPSYMAKIRIHHYAVKSLEEFAKRAGRGDARFGAAKGLRRYSNDYFKSHDRNEVLDPIMDKWIKELKRKM
ncbi:MAG: glycosyltransferase family 92 protein [Alphaproteobacteria bacterium]|nr:glycosyltransferase family 92 protein [Alphaproteobacteria bacterium]MCL2758531.1 glycosyltransferase family 92 protein [Alphaproteobacteria bacterium]